MERAEQTILQMQFDGFCKKVLRNEVRDIYRQEKRRSSNEITFSMLTTQELEQLQQRDIYPCETFPFSVAGCEVTVQDFFLGEALESLTKKKRTILLLFYFLGLSDGRIGELLGLSGRTVYYHRRNALDNIKQLLEVCRYGD